MSDSASSDASTLSDLDLRVFHWLHTLDISSTQPNADCWKRADQLRTDYAAFDSRPKNPGDIHEAANRTLEWLKVFQSALTSGVSSTGVAATCRGARAIDRLKYGALRCPRWQTASLAAMYRVWRAEEVVAEISRLIGSSSNERSVILSMIAQLDSTLRGTDLARRLDIGARRRLAEMIDLSESPYFSTLRNEIPLAE